MFFMHMNIMIAHGSTNNRGSHFPASCVPPSAPPKTRIAPTMASVQTASPLHPPSQFRLLLAAEEPEDADVRFLFGSIVSTPSTTQYGPSNDWKVKGAIYRLIK